VIRLNAVRFLAVHVGGRAPNFRNVCQASRPFSSPPKTGKGCPLHKTASVLLGVSFRTTPKPTFHSRHRPPPVHLNVQHVGTPGAFNKLLPVHTGQTRHEGPVGRNRRRGERMGVSVARLDGPVGDPVRVFAFQHEGARPEIMGTDRNRMLMSGVVRVGSNRLWLQKGNRHGPHGHSRLVNPGNRPSVTGL
jgi:hypothetical protein